MYSSEEGQSLMGNSIFSLSLKGFRYIGWGIMTYLMCF